MRELSTAMQTAWIERVFSRLAALYGAPFGRQWAGTNLDEVMAVWAEKLGGFSAAQIGYGLTQCDGKPYPPNLPEFIGFCRSAPKLQAPSLPAPEIPPEVAAERAATAEKTSKRLASPVSSGLTWAHKVVARWDSGEYPSYYGYKLACEALGIEMKPRGSAKPNYRDRQQSAAHDYDYAEQA